MMLEVTRKVVSDLWPLVRADEASADSRTLVETFLAQDPAYAETLRASESLRGVVPAVRLSADAERRLLDDARERAQMKLLIVGGSIVLGALVLLTALVGALFVVFQAR
jgi:hypothetical protein